ncbi:Ribosome production factor 1, partial [Spiromyces aspiralis]
MPNPKPKKSKISAIEPSSIKNKARREEVYRAQRAAKAKTKHERRRELKKIEEENPEKKEERLKKNIVKTQENMREFDETVVNMEDDEA